MFNKKLQKFSIRKLTVGAASVLIGISFVSVRDNNTVHASDIPVVTSAQTSSASSAIETAQAHVDSAQSNFNKAQSNLSDAQQRADQAYKEYEDQAYKDGSVGQEVTAIKQVLDQENKDVLDLQKLVDMAKDPNVKNNAQKDVTNKETALTNLQEVEKVAETKANNAAQEVIKASQDVNSKQSDVNAKQADKNKTDADVKAAQDALTKAQSKLNTAKQNQIAANKDLAANKEAIQQAQNALNNARSYLDNLNNAPKLLAVALNNQKIEQSYYDTAKKNDDAETEKLNNLESALDAANKALVKAKAGVSDAQQELSSAKSELASAQSAYEASQTPAGVNDAQQELSNGESELASAQSAYEASQTPAINNFNSKETPMIGVAHIKNRVTLVNGKGEAVSQTINADTNYKVFAKKTINGKTYYRLGTDNQWVVADAVSSITDGITTKSNTEELFAAHGYMPVLKSHPTWKIALVDGNGNYTGQYLPTNTNWKVFAKKTINGQTYYRLSTDQQWIPANFLQVKKTGVVKANPVKNHPTWKIALLNQNGEYTGEFVKPNTSWKVLDVEFINGRMMARIGNQAQWIPMDYVAWVK